MKRFNINEFIWFIVLAMFTFFSYHLISTGQIFKFIHPHLLKYTMVSFVIFGVLAAFQLFNVFKVKTRAKPKKGFLLFFIVIAVGFISAPKGLTPEIKNKKGVILVTSNNIENIGRHIHGREETIEGDTIVFNARNYVHYLEDLSSNIESHKGKKVYISGFIHKEDKLLEDEFILSRLLMNCCAADAQVLGVMCQYEGAKNLEDNIWVNIEGEIRSDVNYLAVKVNKIEKSEEPENTYIYE